MPLPASCPTTNLLLRPSLTTTNNNLRTKLLLPASLTTANLRPPLSRSSFGRPLLTASCSSSSVRPPHASAGDSSNPEPRTPWIQLIIQLIASRFGRPLLSSAVRPLHASAGDLSNPEPRTPWIQLIARYILFPLVVGLALYGLMRWGVGLVNSRDCYFLTLLATLIEITKLAGWI